MNDGIYLPYDATRAQAFALGIRRLQDGRTGRTRTVGALNTAALR